MRKNEIRAIYVNTKGEIDVDVSKISCCQCHSLDECEHGCSKYYNCNTVAYANDLYWSNLKKIDRKKVKTWDTELI